MTINLESIDWTIENDDQLEEAVDLLERLAPEDPWVEPLLEAIHAYEKAAGHCVERLK